MSLSSSVSTVAFWSLCSFLRRLMYSCSIPRDLRALQIHLRVMESGSLRVFSKSFLVSDAFSHRFDQIFQYHWIRVITISSSWQTALLTMSVFSSSSMLCPTRNTIEPASSSVCVQCSGSYSSASLSVSSSLLTSISESSPPASFASASVFTLFACAAAFFVSSVFLCFDSIPYLRLQLFL